MVAKRKCPRPRARPAARKEKAGASGSGDAAAGPVQSGEVRGGGEAPASLGVWRGAVESPGGRSGAGESGGGEEAGARRAREGG